MNRAKSLLAAAIFLGLASSAVFAQAGGADTYKSKCAMCHGADGSASSPAGKAMKTPSFLSADQMSVSDAEYIAIIKSGKGKMPAYSSKLSGPEIKGVVAYIRTLQKK